MNDIKVGDIIICIDDGLVANLSLIPIRSLQDTDQNYHPSLTLNKSYYVEEINLRTDTIRIKNDKNEICGYYLSRFKKDVKHERKLKLKKIINE